jgi:hypothetical protein
MLQSKRSVVEESPQAGRQAGKPLLLAGCQAEANFLSIKLQRR